MTPNLFIAAGMRSGSTHIKNCLVQLGWKPVSTHISLEGYYNEEHMVGARIGAAIFPVGGFVVQQHSRAIGHNVPILDEYKVPVLVTYRNLFDCVLSWKESTRKDSETGKRGQYTFAPILIPNWTGWSEPKVELWIVNNVVPWYISHFISWHVAPLKKKFFRYDEYYADQVKSFREVLAFMGVDDSQYPESLLRAVTSRIGGKFNVGKSGRGLEELSHVAIDAVYDQVRCWGHWAPELRRKLL